MKIASTKNTMRGITFGIINKAVVILMPFLIRSILIHRIGVEYAGLDSLFTSILRVLNMAELGFASAAAYSLYKPVAEDNTEKICALMAFYRKLYYSVGVLVMIIGISLLPFLNHLIKGSHPEDINLKILYIIYLLDSAASYFLFSYRNIILNVYQRVDIISIISTILYLVVYGIQIITLLTLKNYYVYVVLFLVYTVANNLIIAKYVKNRFPQYSCKGHIDKRERKDILKNSYAIFLFKVCSMTRNSLDTVFISAFIGLVAATIYGNYYYIFAGIASVQTIIRTSMEGGIGNKIATKTPEENHKDMFVLMYLYAWLSSAITACLVSLYQPFIKIWVGDKLLLDQSTMIMFCVYFYILSMGSIRFIYHQSAGLFWKKRYWTVAAAILNVAGDYFLVQYWGMFGVISATIISLLVVDFGYSSKIIYDYYFKNGKIRMYFKKHILYLFITFLGCAPAYIICNSINITGILGLIIKLITALVTSNLIFFLCYRNVPEYSSAVQLVKKAIGVKHLA